MKFRRSESFPDSTPEDAVSIQARIGEIDNLIRLQNQSILDSFAKKVEGKMHDGEHNIAVSYIGQIQDGLLKEKQTLLRRRDTLQGLLARKALGS